MSFGETNGNDDIMGQTAINFTVNQNIKKPG